MTDKKQSEPHTEPGRKNMARERVPSRDRSDGSGAADEKLTAAEAEEELGEALEQTFPASDPIAMESTLVSGGRRGARGR